MSTPSKPTVLFVDDEPNILQALQRMMRTERDTLDMSFAGGSVEALAALEQTQFDVIVTDMRMPVMNGAELLDEVRLRFPQTVRIVLSGHTDREYVFEAVRSTHQYLAKPCDPAMLKETIHRSLSMRSLITNDSLKQTISRCQAVPSQQSSLEAFEDVLLWGTGGVSRLGRIVSADMGLSAKCLQLVSSAFFGTPRGACAPEQAVILLGTETLKQLYAINDVFTPFPSNRLCHLEIDELWAHGMLTARIARRIAEHENMSATQVDATFVAAFLHDMGKLILAAEDPNAYDSLPDWSGPISRSMEQDLFGASHDIVGAYLLSLWGFSPEIIEAVAWHHSPRKSSLSHAMPLVILHAANHIAHQSDETDRMDTIDIDYLRQAGVASHLPCWRETAAEILMDGVYR
jgi:putative nucleotidyltransferase with HDIG domain